MNEYGSETNETAPEPEMLNIQKQKLEQTQEVAYVKVESEKEMTESYA